ncbi:hypothetical protein DES53_101446 [Roseimicrobium gellanilyticum]|uniref:Uncharacterized protein n=1 Tax=Roseimicrobium gellanilyticum TaxID=748857 RepID=A0A366HVC8_9BACT|nr:hypothetical protein [Roseimicrobium gellanilyticum]RBP47649.1 hypothetical protein DES53_101446 [Roseimicrobium gellanilyticum]
METSNQTEDSSTPYGYDEPVPQGQEQGQESPQETADASWGWQPTPPVTRATAAFEPPEPQQAAEPAYFEAPQPLSLPLPEPPAPQHFYSPKVQAPLHRPQATQPLEQAPAPQPVAAPPTPTQRVPQPVPSTAAAVVSPRRKAILSEESEKAEELGLSGRSTTSYMVSGVRHANKRRSNSLFKLLGLLFVVNLLIMGAGAAWLYNHFVTQVEARIADFASRPPSNSAPATARVPLAAGTGGATAVEIKQLQDDFDKRFSDMKSQLQAAQSRITEFESSQQQQQTRVSALATQMATAAGDAATNGAAGEAVASAVVPGVEAEIAPSANELILLKERNRLTNYADEAIATGAREPYDRLWEALEDPRLIKLIHAARAEILRVQNFYLSGSRIESYTIQVGDYFPDNAALKDSQLRDEQLIELLEKKENPWQVRMKAANLLGLRRSRAVGDALVRAVKYDPNLDVVKEATFSFEQMSGYRARIFEPASMDAWWTQYNAGPGSAAATEKNTTAAVDTNTKSTKKSSPPPQAIPVPSPAPMKEMQPELRLPEWDEEQEARERADKAVSDQQKARDKKDAEKQKQAAAKAAGEEKAPEKKKKSE